MRLPMVLLARPVATFRVFTFSLIGLVTLSGSVPAASTDDSLIRHGLDLRRQGKDQEALEAFQKAFEDNKSARCLAQIGLAEQALGRWVDAEVHVGQALSEETNPWIRKNRETLATALTEVQRHVGSLEIIGPESSEVRVNGLAIGTLPFPKAVRVPIGLVNVELRKDGYLPSTRPVSIAPGVLTRESISLQKMNYMAPQERALSIAPSAESIARSPPLPLAVVPSHDGGRKNVEGEDTVGEATSHPRTWQRPVAWSLAGAAVVGTGAGIGALLLRHQKLQETNNLRCNVASGTVSPEDPGNAGKCLSLANDSSKLGVTAVVAFSVAGALAIGSIILFATTPDAAAAETLACAPALTTPGATCQIRF
jgi:tetratricopeptide (TPR) repeat protein